MSISSYILVSISYIYLHRCFIILSIRSLSMYFFFFFFSSRRRHTRYWRDWSSDVCSSDLTVLILLVFVWLITRRLKYLFLIVTALVVNIAVALIFYYFFGLEMQLYSLAGITVSLNLVIDSTIVMAEHILHRRNLKAFMSVLAAAVTPDRKRVV